MTQERKIVMPNAAEIIKELSAKLENYRMFAVTRGFSTDEAVEEEVKKMLEEYAKDNTLK